MRIQNEIVGERFNCFADIVDMDRLAEQEYTPDVIVDISESFVDQKNVPVLPLNLEAAGEIVRMAKTSAVGVPQLIQMAMQEVKTDV